MAGVASIITAGPSQPNAKAEVQEVKQLLLGSAQQTSPSTSSTPQAVANLEATENLSQCYATVTRRISRTRQRTLRYFYFRCFTLYTVGFGGYFCWMLYSSFMSFLGPRESVFEFRAWSTCSVIYLFCSSQTCYESCVIISCFSFVMVMLVFSWMFG